MSARLIWRVMTTPSCAPQRVLVYGVTGSGKSHAAQRIAEIYGLPLVLADELAWQPGWRQVEPEAQCGSGQPQREIFTRLAARDRWAFDTAYGIWRDVVLSHVDLIVALDYPRWLSLLRLLSRTLHRMLTRERVCNGNIESVRHVFSRESIIVWHFRSFERKRQRIQEWSTEPDGPPILTFRRPRDLERWCETQRRGALS